jgi:hypothetical protein
MKTPREILFERHRQAEPKLDAVRRKALAALPAAGSVHNAHFNTPGAFRRARAVLGKAWLELIWPSRRAWAGMAVLWLVVMAANLEMKATTNVPAVRLAHTRELARAFEERQRLLAELLLPASPPPAAAALSNPGPRSEWLTLFKAG